MPVRNEDGVIVVEKSVVVGQNSIHNSSATIDQNMV